MTAELPPVPVEIEAALTAALDYHEPETSRARWHALNDAIRRALAAAQEQGTELQRAALRLLLAENCEAEPLLHDKPHENKTCPRCNWVRELNAARAAWEALREQRLALRAARKEGT